MEVKEKLNQIYKLNKLLKKLHDDITYYEAMSNSIPGQDFTKERVDCTPSLEAPFLKWIYKKSEAEEKIKVVEQKIKQAKEELFSLFENLDDVNYKYILSYRYIELLSWQEIADKIKFSLPTTYRYHKLAIAKLESLENR